MKKELLFSGALLLAGTSFGQVVLSEDFESGLPVTWTQTTNATDGGWNAGTAASLSSQFWAISGANATDIVGTNDDDCNCDKSADRLISPVMNLTGGSSYFLSVDVFFNEGSYQGATESMDVEVSTDGGATWSNLATVTGDAEWRTELFDISAYAGNATVWVSFLYNDDGGWVFGSAIDNFEVYAPVADDAALSAANIVRYANTNTNSTLELDVQNLGSNTITAITVEWNDGSGANSQTINTNIAPGASATVNHPTAVNYATATEAVLDVSITQVNGNNDGNPSNNDLSGILHNTVTEMIAHNVLIEEGTGTWCGWCPRGKVAMQYMYQTYPDQFIGINVHNGDVLTVTAYDNAANFGGFPSCNVDRVLLDQGVSQQAFEQYYNDRSSLVSPVDIGVTVSGTGSSVTLDVDAEFVTPISSADFRLAVVIMESNITGTSSQYDQSNFYSFQSQNIALVGPDGFDWQAAPNPVPAADMKYDWIGRALLGGYDGQAGSVPASLTAGQVASYQFNYNVPGTSDRDEMHAVAMLIDQSTGEVVQSVMVPLGAAGLESEQLVSMSVFPNPSDDVVNVSFEAKNAAYAVTITDLAGRVVMTNNYGNLSGAQTIEVPVSDLNPGNYMISVSTDGASSTQIISVK